MEGKCCRPWVVLAKGRAVWRRKGELDGVQPPDLSPAVGWWSRCASVSPAPGAGTLEGKGNLVVEEGWRVN